MNKMSFGTVFSLCAFMVLGTSAVAETITARDVKAAREFDMKIPVNVKAPAAAVLKACEPARGTRYVEALRNLGKKDQACLQEDVCTGKKASEDLREASREFLSELRKVREGELYQIEAMNALLYDPEFKTTSPKGIDSDGMEKRLILHLCERSNLAVQGELESAIRKKFISLPKGIGKKDYIAKVLKEKNACKNPDSEVSGLIAMGAQRALEDFKKRRLSQPDESDLKELNRNLATLREKCDPFIPVKKKQDPFQELHQRNSIQGDNVRVAGREELGNQVHQVQKSQNDARYQKEVFPIVAKVFSSPYGRLLADSKYLHGLIGLDLNTDWNTAWFCHRIKKQGVSITQRDMNTAYFGSPTAKIAGLKAITRTNIGSLALTRVPELRPKFWKPIEEASVFQSETAQVQQQVAYELMYHSSHPRVRALVQKNPLYADLACRAMEHEALWEKKSVQEAMGWVKNIALYGGIGVGLASGFFTGGAGWVAAAALASGVGLGAIGSSLELHEGLQNAKVSFMDQENKVHGALKEQTGVGVQDDPRETNAKIDKLQKKEQEKVKGYQEQFEAALGARMLSTGAVISGSKSPDELRLELLKTAKDEKEEYLINLAYNAASAVVAFNAGKLLNGLKGAAQAKNLTKIEKIAEIGAKLESGVVGPTDIADAFGSCLILKDCTGAGVIMGAGMKVGTTSLGRLFSAFRGLKGNEGKTRDELLNEIADAISKEHKVSKEDVLARLKAELNEKDLQLARGSRTRADGDPEGKTAADEPDPEYRETFVRDEVKTLFSKPQDKLVMTSFLKYAKPRQKLALQEALTLLKDANLTAGERARWLKKIRERASGCKIK